MQSVTAVSVGDLAILIPSFEGRCGPAPPQVPRLPGQPRDPAVSLTSQQRMPAPTGSSS